LIFYVTVNLCLSLVSGVPPLLFSGLHSCLPQVNVSSVQVGINASHLMTAPQPNCHLSSDRRAGATFIFSRGEDLEIRRRKIVVSRKMVFRLRCGYWTVYTYYPVSRRGPCLPTHATHGHLSVWIVIATFHYTGPTGPDRTRTDFFAAKLRWVRAGLLQSPCGSVRVRAGPVGPV